MAGPVTITCPVCQQAFPVPTEVLGTDGHQVVVRMDRSELYGHLQECTAESCDQRPDPEGETDARASHPAGKALERPARGVGPVALPPFVATGRRPCLMCRTDAPACMVGLQGKGTPCCGACGEGNTHPAPGESTDCRVWAAEHGAKA